MELLEQSTGFRMKAAAYWEIAQTSADRHLREQFAQLAARYLDIAQKLESLSVATAVVEKWSDQREQIQSLEE